MPNSMVKTNSGKTYATYLMHNENVAQNAKNEAASNQGNFWSDIPIFCGRICSYFSCNCRKNKKSSQLNELWDLNEEGAYSSGESDSEFVSPFNVLNTPEKTRRILWLWKKTFAKSKGGALLVQKLVDLRQKIKLLGRLDLTRSLYEDEDKIDISQARCVFLPEGTFKRRWNLWIAILLIYTGIFVPLRIAFYDQVDLWVIIVECFVDLCFFCDIVFSFTTAFDRRDGQIETRHKKIAKRYFKGWFFIDLISTVPTQLLEVDWGSDLDLDDASNVKLMRLARIPRIYKIVRLLRLLKMLRFLTQQKQFAKFTDLF